MIKLKDYQVDGVNLLLRDSSQLLCDEQGLGKTATTIVAVLRRSLYPILVVCPASLKINWREEFKRFGGVSTDIDDITRDIVIINYESLVKYKYDLYDRGFKQVIFDEAHVLKNSNSIRGKIALELSRRIPFKILITGTPLLNRPLELWHLIEILGWQQRFNGKEYFLNRYCGNTLTRYGVNYHGFSNLDELKEKFLPMIIRRKKSILGNQLPKKYIVNVPLIDVKQPLPTSFQDIARQDKDVLLCKFDLSIDFIKNKLQSENKVVVFTHHRDITVKIVDVFKNEKVSYIIGGQSIRERQKNIDDFQNGDSKIIVCSLLASAVGLTLTSAHIAIFLEYPWSPSLLVQAQDRIHRLSQVKDCYIYYLYAKDSIDEYRLASNMTKQAVIDYIME